MGILTYLFVPVFMILIGFGLKKSPNNNRLFSFQSIELGVISILFVYIIFKSNSEYIGLYQRIVEFAFVLWIILCAFLIKNKTCSHNTVFK